MKPRSNSKRRRLTGESFENPSTTEKEKRGDEIDILVSGIPELQDINEDPNGKSSKAQDRSAATHFIAFYRMHVGPVISMDDEVLQSVSRAQIGTFCDYLVKNPSIGWQSSMNYLSSVRRQLEQKHKIHIFKDDPKWYSETRKRVSRAYVLACLNDGKKLTDYAPPMSQEDLRLLGRHLFCRNDIRSSKDRTLINAQWVSMGRASDLAD
ncbi:hypothetical protein AeRB84_017678 [Aphanomyces euteiches]|nr:hypothetical protein AeRB84_017678 [Aphanomyces euteiches]